jgi:hypothetical protein
MVSRKGEGRVSQRGGGRKGAKEERKGLEEEWEGRNRRREGAIVIVGVVW